jgi:hypothetical protein
MLPDLEPSFGLTLKHACWLHNRTHHSAIGMTPHQAFTQRKPTLDNLLTFGCRVTPKASKDQTSTLDPNSHHHAVFFGCLPNNDIRHWDIKTQQEKMAGHKEHDKLQCGEDPTECSPASKHMLNIMTGADHLERRTDIMHKQPVVVTDKPDLDMPMDTTQLVLDSAPPPCTATAAKFERPNCTRPRETELVRQLQQLEASLSVFDRSAKERISLQGNHPALGLVTEPHSDLKRAVVVTQMMLPQPRFRAGAADTKTR